MSYRHAICFLLFAICLQTGRAVVATDSFRLHTDLPLINKDDKMYLNVFCSADSIFKGTLQVQLYKFNSPYDSTLVVNKQNWPTTFKKGTGKARIIFHETDSNTYYHKNFYEILKRTGNIPPGAYKIYLTVKGANRQYQATYLHDIDSLLPPTSPVRQDINKSLAPKSKSVLGMRLQKIAGKQGAGTGAEQAFTHARGKMDKAMKKRGLGSEHYERNGKSYMDLYYDGWFAGRYEVQNKERLEKQLDEQDKLANANNVNTDLDHPSLYSQYKKKNQDKKDKEDTKGEIGITTNLASGQEQYSGIDNNYYEIRGRIETPIVGIPVEMEGLYTSQDNHREIKSSYFKIHYDVEKMKENLNKSINSYNNKFAETKSKGVGMQQVYMTSISNLERQRNVLQNELNSQTGNAQSVKPNSGLQNSLARNMQKEATDTSGLKQAAENGEDSTDTANNSGSKEQDSTASNLKNKSSELKGQSDEERRKLESKKKELEVLDRKIEKYKTLLAQYENTNHFDSLLAYSKTKALGGQDMTYKQMAKRGDALLPDGQAKGFIAGITNFDAGMFPKDASMFTMNGQMMKGIDFGYDLGICQAGVTAGKTEYVGRDGSLDKYTCYSERTTFTPIKHHKLSLIYYGYTADRKIRGDAFFNNANISAPSFFEPVHIFSLKYEGAVSKYVTAGGEAATSIKSSDNTDIPKPSLNSKMAYHFNVNGNIPNTAIRLESSYDKTGLNFTNNTLPISLSGTEQYRVSGQNDFFRSLVTAGVEYDRLSQTSFATRGTSTKWGFNVRTNFKRYPNIAITYKPFTTFRSFTDTLNMPQHPLLGSVWTGKASYQIKRQGHTWRFLVLYNRCSTTMDTTSYNTRLAQMSTIYTDKILMASVNVGHSQMSSTGYTLPATSPNNTSFLSVTGSYTLSKQLSISGGQDYGIADFGFCRFAMNGGFTYRPEKKPFVVRFNMRFNTYELNRGEAWHQLYSGCFDVVYKFKMKNAKNSF